MSETKRIITDTERIDFIESRVRHYENVFGEGRETAWGDTIYGPPANCTKDANFRFATLRDSIDAAITGIDPTTVIPTVNVIEGPSAISAFEPTETHDYDRTDGGTL